MVEEIFSLYALYSIHLSGLFLNSVDMLSHKEPPSTISLTYTIHLGEQEEHMALLVSHIFHPYSISILGLECLLSIIEAMAIVAEGTTVVPLSELRHAPVRRGISKLPPGDAPSCA